MLLTLFYYFTAIVCAILLYPFTKSLEKNYDSSFYQICKGAFKKHCINKKSLIYAVIFFVIALSFQYLTYNNFFIYSFSSLFTLLFLTLVCCAGIIDKNKNIIPDIITYPLILFGFAAAINSPFVFGFEDAVLGAIIGYMLPSIIGFAYELFKGYQGIGSGDIKFLAGIGAWLGFIGLIYSIFFAAVLSILFLFIFKKRNVPFAPYAVGGIIFYLIFFIM